MNTKRMAIASTIGALAIAALIFAYPAVATSTATSQNSNLQQILQRSATLHSQEIQLSAGQTVNLTGVAGGYWVVGDRSVNGTASASMTLQVTGTFAGGFALAVTGGSLTINGTTYTISDGSAELGAHGICIVGQGQAGTAQFLFQGRDLGKFGDTYYGVLRIDLQSGSSEFGARLLVTVSV
jgi:hypothetical protein